MESNAVYEYQQIIKQIRKCNFECKIHLNNQYIAYCSICKLNICEKCLNNNLRHIGHKIYYFKKMFLSEKQTKYYQKIYLFCQYYLNKIREIVIELLSDLSDAITNKNNSSINKEELIRLKSQLKNTYKFFYIMNTYQMGYFENVLSLYFFCRKLGYINFQLIYNIYNIKLNEFRMPELNNKDISKRVIIMIEFLNNSKNNNVLKSSDSEPLLPFYTSKVSNNMEDPKVNRPKIELNSIILSNYKGELFGEDDNSIFSYDSTDMSESCMEYRSNLVNNNYIIENNEKIKIKSHIIEDNKINNNNINEKKEENKFYQKKDNIFHTYDINNSESYKMNEELNNNSNNIEDKIYIKDKGVHDNKKIIIKKIEDNKNSTLVKKEKENKVNEINSYEKIKKNIYSILTKPCKDQVEYRDVKYIYIDKVKNNKVKCEYHGEFKKGTLKRHGRGFFIWEDGEFYIGYWANDKREGEGTNTYTNGNIYQGAYKNGKKEGEGIYKWSNGDLYQGTWKNDMMHGKGRYEFSNGDVYDGYFKKDKINGNGTYTFANKKSYKGKFKNNLFISNVNNND
jgi:hypothetical protein